MIVDLRDCHAGEDPDGNRAGESQKPVSFVAVCAETAVYMNP